MLLDLIFNEKIKRGKLTVCANILLCVTLLSRVSKYQDSKIQSPEIDNNINVYYEDTV